VGRGLKYGSPVDLKVTLKVTMGSAHSFISLFQDSELIPPSKSESYLDFKIK
jgi:hypothetical protein